MSLLRQRATDVNVESTLRAGRPAFARLRLVRVTSSASDEELKEPASQAKVRAGVAKAKIDVTGNRPAPATGSPRGGAGARGAGARDGRGGTGGPRRWGIWSGRSEALP